MKVPILELTPALVGPPADRMVLAYIETIMLWPTDEKQRDHAFRASHAAHIRE